MATETEVVQYWVRSGKGTVWGPISFATVALFVDNNVIAGAVQVSHDGVNFADPGRFLDLRDAFPPEMWGNSSPAPSKGPVQGASPAVPGPPPSAAAGSTRPRLAPASAGPPTLGPADARRPTGAVPSATGQPGPPTLSGPAPAPAPARAPAGPPSLAPSPAAPPSAPAAPTPAPSAAAVVPPVAKPSSSTGIPSAASAAVPAKAPAQPGAGIEDVPEEGALGEELSPLRLYYLLASQAATGKLTLRTPEATYELMMRKGVPHVVRSDQPGDSVLMYFGEKGLIKSEGVAKAEAAAGQFGGDPVAAAFAQGLISNPGDAVAAIASHGQGMLKKLLLEGEGTFSYQPDVAPPASSMALGQKWQLVSQVGRAVPVEMARKRLGDRMDMPVMKATGRVPLSDLALNAQEARVAAAFEGVKTVSELASGISGVDESVVLRVCYFLGELELASFAAIKKRVSETIPEEPEPEPELPPAAPPPPVAPPPAATRASPAPKSKSIPGAKVGAAPKAGPGGAGVKPASPPPRPAGSTTPGKPVSVAPPSAPARSAPAVDSNDLATVKRIAAELPEQNHFQVLGIAETASGAQVRSAFLQMVKLFHPDSTPPTAAEGVKELKEAIFTRINEANAALVDDKARADYLQDLKDGVADDEKVDVAAIFKAEDLFLKATIMIKARKYTEGLASVEEAIALNGVDGEFYAWRGYAKFMLASDRRSAYASSLAEAEKALKMSPKCASAAYLAGMMTKLLEDGAGAARWFKMALELDPNYVDATRELKALR